MALGKRYEIYFPLEYNPDQHGNRLPIEKGKFDQTYKELWQEFRGMTISPESENQAFRGLWLNESDQLFKDKVLTVMVYAIDINKADYFFRQALNLYKERHCTAFSFHCCESTFNYTMPAAQGGIRWYALW